MNNLGGRATRGGVGTVLFGLALTAVALLAGWLAGAAYDTRPGEGATSFSSDVLAAEAPPRLDIPTPTPTLPAGFPYVSANSIALVEGNCGALIYGRNEHDRMRPASLTKLMTAAVAVDQASLDLMITSDVDGAALQDETGSTVMGLQPGMELSLLDLLYGLLLPSGNDAAIAIADGVAGSQEDFVELMNAKAQSLALDDSHFANPHGLDDDDLYSSAYDMAVLARYVMENPDLRTIVATTSWQPRWDGGEVWNGNAFILDYEGADGVKIGNTESAQQTIVGSATRGGRRIIVSLMRSQDRYQDSARLFDWAFAQPSACP